MSKNLRAAIRIANKTREAEATNWGVTLKQICEGYARNAESSRKMLARAEARPNKMYNGYTVDELRESVAYYTEMSVLPADYVYPVPVKLIDCNYYDEVVAMFGLNKTKTKRLNTLVRNNFKERLLDCDEAKTMIGEANLLALYNFINKKPRFFND